VVDIPADARFMTPERSCCIMFLRFSNIIILL